MSKIYFAHPVWTYGTYFEEQVLEALAQDLRLSQYELVNPNGPEHQEGYKAKGWKYFEDLVDSCDAVVYAVGDLPVWLGGIPAGVWGEAARAQTLGKPCWEYTDDVGFCLMSEKDESQGQYSTFFHDTRPLSVNETRELRNIVLALQDAQAALKATPVTADLDQWQENLKQREKALESIGKVNFPSRR